MKLPSLVLSVLAFTAASAASGADSSAIPLVRDRQPAAVIVYAPDDALAARMARRLADYVFEHTGTRLPLTTDPAGPPADRDTTAILLDGAAGQPLARRFGESAAIDGSSPDAYVLRGVIRPGAPPLILAAGRGATGMKFAVYRLMRELEIDAAGARLAARELRAAPAIATRSAALFNVWSMPIDLTRRHNTESWPVERLEQYVDMYDAFGFNAIESHDRFNDNYLEPLFGLKRADWRAKVLRMSEHAHANGQQFFLRIWGHTVMNTPKFTQPLGPTSSVPKRLAYLCVNDPAERKRWEQEIRDYYVNHYAGRIDHLIGHWCDPGVCRRNGCDYRTPLQLQMELHRAFKAVDPKFTSSFSLWFFDVTKNNPAGWARGGWPGYQNDFDLINAGILDRDVIIATATTKPDSYQEDVVQAILAAGHRPAVWTWYRADHEIRPSLHVHLHERLGDYFRGLPASSRQLAWHNVERNVHGAANTANYYVAGRLMWEPELEVDAVLREFLSLVFGPGNAAHVMPAYLAIERIRCHSCFNNWESARFTGMGTPDPRADLAQAQAALEALDRLRLPAEHRPRLPLDVAPAQIVSDLAASLTVVRDFARCRAEELPVVSRAVTAGDRATAERQLAALEQRYGAWTHSLAGRQEWSVLQAFIKEQRQRLQPE